MPIHPYRWRLTPSFAAHLWKALTQQHHRALMPLLARYVPRDAVVLDVGAHAGQITKLLSRLAADGRVYAIEPASYARAILRTVVWWHRLGNVAVVPVALGAETRLERLFSPIKASGAIGFGLAHLGASEAPDRPVAEEVVVQTTIDELTAELALDRLDFIKADIEGSEMRLLTGAQRTIERFRPCLLLELDSTRLARVGDRVADAFAFLQARGYRAFAQRQAGALAPVAPGDGDIWFLPPGASVPSIE